MQTWFRLPQLVRGVVIAAAWFGYATLVLSLLTSESAGRIAMYFAIACVMGAAITVGADGAVRGRFASPTNVRTYYRALASGQLPADAELDEWRDWLLGTSAANVAAFVLGGPFVGFGLASSVVSPSAYHWLATAAFGVLCVGCVAAFCTTAVWVKRLTAQVNRRQETLKQAAGTPVTARAGRKEVAFDASMAVRVLTNAITGFTVAFLVLLIADLEPLVFGGPRIASLGWAAAWAALGAGWALRRNLASFEQYAEYNETIRTGGMPADIEPDVWRRRLNSTRVENLMRLLVAGFLVAVGVSSILTDQSVYRWVTALLFELLAMWFLFHWWAMRQRLARLAAEVDRRAIRETFG
jgi:hypothetical protein